MSRSEYYMMKALFGRSRLIVTREELEYIISYCKPPIGLVWSWTTIGALLGYYKLF
ncbi:hypothetical protein [Pyrococcus kukulkanii]|nr:hypothetical protein [Pyrococcus kukulkanii]